MADQTLWNRWDVAKVIVELARSDGRLAGVLIEPGWPGEDNLRPDTIWISDFDGAITYPFGTAGRKVRDDRYDIPFQVRVADRPTLDATMLRLQELVGVLEDIIADDPTADACPGVMMALVSNIRMASGFITPDGPIGFAEVTVSPFARYL